MPLGRRVGLLLAVGLGGLHLGPLPGQLFLLGRQPRALLGQLGQLAVEHRPLAVQGRQLVVDPGQERRLLDLGRVGGVGGVADDVLPLVELLGGGVAVGQRLGQLGDAGVGRGHLLGEGVQLRPAAQQPHAGRRRAGLERAVGLDHLAGVGDEPEAGGGRVQGFGDAQGGADDGRAQQHVGDEGVGGVEPHQVAGQADAVRGAGQVGEVDRAGACRPGPGRHGPALIGLAADHVHPPLQLGEGRRRSHGGRQVVGHEPLVAAVERRLDHPGVLHVHPQHVGDQTADEREPLLPLPQDGFDALADALAAGLQILEHLLPGHEPRPALAGRAQLLAHAGQPLAQGGGVLLGRLQLGLPGGDQGDGLVQPRLHVGPAGGGRLGLGRDHRLAVGQPLLVVAQVPPLDVDRPEPVGHLRRPPHQVQHGRLVLLDLAVERVQLQLSVLERPLLLFEIGPPGGQVGRERRQPFGVGRQRPDGRGQLRLQRGPVAVERLHLLGHLPQLPVGVLLLLLGRLQRGPGLHLLVLGPLLVTGDGVGLLPRLGQGRRLVPGVAGQVVHGEGGVVHRLGQLGRPAGLDVVLVQRQLQPHFGQPRRVFLVNPSPAGLDLHAPQLLFDLGHDVVHPQQVLVDPLELAAGLLPLGLELRDAGRLLEDQPPLGRVGLEQRRDAALLDHAVGVDADAGVHEQVTHVPEAAGLAVQVVLAGPVAVEAAADADLVGVDGQRAGAVVERFGVVEREHDLGHAGRFAGGGPVEQDVHHGVPAEALGALLAQDPLEGVDDVALAAPVGADDAGHGRVEDELGAVGEALEAVDDQLAEPHPDHRGRG